MTEVEPEFLIVPGWGNSGPDHWQSHWERVLPRIRRVEQHDWDRPDRTEWTTVIERAVAHAAKPLILVAHSLGCVAIAHWASQGTSSRVRAAFLVAPPDVDAETAPMEIRGFRPMPRRRLPFPSTLVVSRTDPWLSFDRAIEVASSWGSTLVDIGDAGHINTASGHGAWPQGQELLHRVVGP